MKHPVENYTQNSKLKKPVGTFNHSKFWQSKLFLFVKKSFNMSFDKTIFFCQSSC